MELVALHPELLAGLFVNGLGLLTVFAMWITNGRAAKPTEGGPFSQAEKIRMIEEITDLIGISAPVEA